MSPNAAVGSLWNIAVPSEGQMPLRPATGRQTDLRKRGSDFSRVTQYLKTEKSFKHEKTDRIDSVSGLPVVPDFRHGGPGGGDGRRTSRHHPG